MELTDWPDELRLACEDAGCAVLPRKAAAKVPVPFAAQEVLPGITVIRNDLHEGVSTVEGPAAALLGEPLLLIDHCREGRLEWEDHARCSHLETGDIGIGTAWQEERFSLPLGYYHGLTLAIDVKRAQASLRALYAGWTLDLKALERRFCGEGISCILRNDETLQEAFDGLYRVPRRVRKRYQQLKVLEILTLLEGTDAPEATERRYFRRTQVDAVKQIADLVTSDLERWYTLAELSERFDFPLTSMQQCFRERYGMSIAAYMKSYRMNAAAVMLRNTDDAVVDIAAKVGYRNPGKFAAAFRSVMGTTPTAYRAAGK